MESTVKCKTYSGKELQELLASMHIGPNEHPLNKVIGQATFVFLPSQTIICELLTKEEHALVNISRPMDATMYDEEKGMFAAFGKTRDALWEVMAYRAKLERNPKLIAELATYYKV